MYIHLLIAEGCLIKGSGSGRFGSPVLGMDCSEGNASAFSKFCAVHFVVHSSQSGW